MPSLSTHAITASNNAAKLPAKSNADNKSADGSPFGVMLAATAAQQAKQPAPKPAADDEHHAAVKKSDTANKDAPAAPKEHHDTVADKDSDSKTADSKHVDTADAKPAGTTDAKDHSAANDNGSTADQIAQAQPQQPVAAPQAQPLDASLLAMAQAGAAQAAVVSAAQPVAADAAANDDAGADSASNVGAAGKDSGKTAAPAAAATVDSGTAGVQAAANGAAPKAPTLPSSGNSKNPTVQAAGKTMASDSKQASASDTSAKAAAQAADATQGQAPQAQTAAPTPPPAPTTNAAAVPALNFGTPVQDNPAAGLSGTVQVSPHAADTQATVNALAVTIAAKTQSGARQFDIRLDPPELGHVEVRLSIDANGKTEAHMTADHQDTLNLLQKDSSSLTQALRDAGLDVSHSGLNFSLRGQGQNDSQGGGDGFGRGQRTGLAARRVLDAAQSATSAISFTGGLQDGRLDIHV